MADPGQTKTVHDSQDRDTTNLRADLRGQSYIDNSIEGAWRVDFEEPIPLELPITDQVELVYQRGYIGEANQALSLQYGFDAPGDIVGFRLSDILPPELPTSISLLTRLAKARYSEQEWESIEQDRHGNRKVFLNNCLAEVEDGKLLSIWGTARDITHQRQLEEENRLRAVVLEQIPDACVITEVESEQFVYMNPAFTEMTGYTMADMPAQKLSFLQGPDTHPDTVAQIRAALAEQVDFQGEILNYRRDGTPFWNLMRISPIKDNAGVVTHYAGILSDISLQKRSQEERQAHRNQLAHVTRVASMGELTAALAHELNQPLTAIMSNAQAALRFLDRETPDVGEVREILQDIVADDRRAGETMRRIRRLVKRDVSQFRRLDVNQLVKEVQALTRQDLVMKKQVLQARLAPDLPAVQGDAVQLQQVILNLIMNASQALQDTDGDEGCITVTTRCLDERTVEITASDSGPGIDEKVLDKIFEPFFTTKENGLGMGLAINRTIVETHGGRLWAENGPGQGAIIHVALPVVPQEARTA